MVQQRLGPVACLPAAALFALSCLLPATDTCNPDGSVRDVGTRGWEWFVMGGAGPVEGLFGWFANPLWLYVLLRLALGKPPAALANLAAVLLAVSAIAIPQSFNLPFDDLHTLHLCNPHVGFACWILALCVPLLLSPALQTIRPPTKQR